MEHASRAMTVIETLHASYKLLHRILLPYLGTLGGFVIAAVVVGQLAPLFSDRPDASGLAVVLLFCSSLPVLSLAGTRIVSEVHAGEAPRVWDALRVSVRLSGAWAVTTGLVFVSVACLSFVLLALGIYFGVSWALTGCVMANEERTYFAAIRRSHALVRGHWWHTTGVLVTAHVLLALPVVVTKVLGLSLADNALVILTLQAIAGAFNSAVVAVLYADLSARKAQPREAAPTAYTMQLRKNAGSGGLSHVTCV